MKHSTRHSNRFDRHHRHGEPAPVSRPPARALPPPDPATRVSLAPPRALVRASERPPFGGRDVIVAVGVGGTAAALALAAVQLLHLPPESELGVAAGSVLLAVVSAIEWRRWRRRTSKAGDVALPLVPVEAPRLEVGVPLVPVEGPVEVPVEVPVDLPFLTSQIGDLLTELRHEHGLAYRSRTWIDDVLPEFGGPLPHPLLARDLLAVAALDAGGIRANVAGLAHDHERQELVTAASALQMALQSVLDACEGSADLPTPPISDQSCWPVLVR